MIEHTRQEPTKCNRCISSGGGDCATCEPLAAPQQRYPLPKRRKGADHFGYGHQVALGKKEDGGGLWHSHGNDYHKPNTYWCGDWGDKTPKEILSECESVIADMRTYHPELFQSHVHTAPAPTACEDNGCTDPEACDEICEHSRIYSPAWVRKHDKEERKRVLGDLIIHFKGFENQRTFQYSAADIIQYLEIFQRMESLRTDKEKP